MKAEAKKRLRAARAEREQKRATLNHGAVSTVDDSHAFLLTTPIVLSSTSAPSPSAPSTTRPSTSHSLQSLLRTRPRADTPKRLLAESLAFHTSLSSLPPPEAASRLQAKAYKAALVRAAGGQVKDDVGRLRKTLKKEGKRKAKSGEEWQQRLREQAKERRERVGKRQANIDQRLQKRKEQKAKKRRGPVVVSNAAA